MERKKIGLALSGGGARGFAHLGALKALVENDVPIDVVSGTSAGSVVGGALAAGMSVDEIIELGKQIGWFSVTSFSYSPRGLLSNRPMGDFISKYFPVRTFEELTLPFAAVAYDLAASEEVVLSGTGDLITAIRASCAVPGVFVPVIDKLGRTLVDGGVTSPMPTRAAKDLGADLLIAVDVLSCGSTFRYTPRTLVGTIVQSAMTVVRTASIQQHHIADVVIEPQIAHIRPDEIGKREELMALGEQAALAKIDQIRALIAD